MISNTVPQCHFLYVGGEEKLKLQYYTTAWDEKPTEC